MRNGVKIKRFSQPTGTRSQSTEKKNQRPCTYFKELSFNNKRCNNNNKNKNKNKKKATVILLTKNKKPTKKKLNIRPL